MLETIRNYHLAVIRPEVFHLVAQIEGVISKLDDRMLQLQDNVNWLSSENRAAQKRESGMMVVLSGFDPKMNAGEAASNQLDAGSSGSSETVSVPETVQRH